MRIQHDLSNFAEVPPITLNVAGDLLITGGERKFIDVNIDEEDPDVVIADDQIFINTSGDMRIQLPIGVHLSLDAGGDVNVQGSRSSIQINAIGGDASIEDALSVEFKNIGGDLRVVRATELTGRNVAGSVTVDEVDTFDVKDVAGDLKVRKAVTVSCNVAGDATLHEISKAVAVNASGDLKLMACHGDVAGNASGDVQIEVLAAAPQVRVNADADIRCILGEAVNAKVRVICGSDLRISGGGGSHNVEGRGVHTFNIGEGEGSISLVSNADVNVTAQGAVSGLRSVNKDMTGMSVEMERLNIEMERLGREMESVGIDLGREFGSLGDRIAEAIGSKLRSKLEKSVRKAAIKAQAKAGKRGFAFEFDFPTPPKSPVPPQPGQPPRPPRGPFYEESSNDPVSDEERMMVLRMLEEGKITVDEAERLIAALEGNHES